MALMVIAEVVMKFVLLSIFTDNAGDDSVDNRSITLS